MARKKKHPEHVNHERWLVSYADFVTMLFAFFVVMFAVSQVDSKKVGRFTESFSKAVGIELFPLAGEGIMPGGITPVPSESNEGKSEVQAQMNDLRSELVRMRGKADLPPDVKVIQRRNELVIRLSDNLLFSPGDDTLKDPSRASVKALGAALAARSVDVRVEGHTDDRPIHTARFRSNWDLATSRAASVVAVLAEAGMLPSRLSAAGYGEFHPIASNDTDEGRKLNRRVDLVVSSSVPLPAEDVAEAEADGGKGAKGAKDEHGDHAAKDEHGDHAAKDEHGDHAAKDEHGDHAAKDEKPEPPKDPAKDDGAHGDGHGAH
jgi:chemotaxis protein MotB